MYIPAINLVTDKAEIVAFMQQFSFATIVTAKNSLPVATHLPFVVTINNGTVVLTAHFAKANPQWKDIEDNPVLVIFSEPHAYISPVHYESEQNVPTWNYISVHAYGRGKLITGKNAVMNVLQATINAYEPAYRQQWDRLPEAYQSKTLNGIVAFEIMVDDLQARKKLSQNRTATEKQHIIDSLSKSSNTNEKSLAAFMRREQQ
jgi:transcriptional regulator